jgi:hypothetical protein
MKRDGVDGVRISAEGDGVVRGERAAQRKVGVILRRAVAGLAHERIGVLHTRTLQHLSVQRPAHGGQQIGTGSRRSCRRSPARATAHRSRDADGTARPSRNLAAAASCLRRTAERSRAAAGTSRADAASRTSKSNAPGAGAAARQRTAPSAALAAARIVDNDGCRSLGAASPCHERQKHGAADNGKGERGRARSFHGGGFL